MCVRAHLFALPFELRKLVLLISLPLVNAVVVQLLQIVSMKVRSEDVKPFIKSISDANVCRTLTAVCDANIAFTES